MSTTFELRTSKRVGYATVQVRVQSSVLGVNIRQSTKLKAPIQKWRLSRDSCAFKNYARTEEAYELFKKLREIEARINNQLETKRAITPEDVSRIIKSVVYTKESCIINVSDYYRSVIEEMKSGIRNTSKGTMFSSGTINAYIQTYHQFIYYQEKLGIIIEFNDIDISFYKNYTAYLESKNYSVNTIGKCISILKAILHYAEHDGFSVNGAYKDKTFKTVNRESDSIYLTKEEIERMIALDLSQNKHKILEQVRDVFIVGVFTAQRVSDYNGISHDCIKNINIKHSHNGIIETKTIKILEIIQQKTKTKVLIPISSTVMTILKKYNYNLPKLRDLQINIYIKQIARMAKIDQIVEVSCIRGGKFIVEHKKKYKLVYSHTARRTGATLMYLAGMDIYDIMKITGHSNPDVLKRYIKADQFDVTEKIVSKYNYFD